MIHRVGILCDEDERGRFFTVSDRGMLGNKSECSQQESNLVNGLLVLKKQKQKKTKTKKRRSKNKPERSEDGED